MLQAVNCQYNINEYGLNYWKCVAGETAPKTCRYPPAPGQLGRSKQGLGPGSWRTNLGTNPVIPPGLRICLLLQITLTPKVSLWAKGKAPYVQSQVWLLLWPSNSASHLIHTETPI